MGAPVLVQNGSIPMWNVTRGASISSAASRERWVPITGAGSAG